jgi:hypothetical protein
MTNPKQEASSQRRMLILAGAAIVSISACEGKPMAATVSLDVVLFSYLSRPIFDVFLNGKDAGDSGAYPATGGGTIAGVQVPLGPQMVKWRYADTGETVTAINAPELQNVPKNSVFLALHIYPDDTVEIFVSEHYPRPSARGEELARKGGATDGK